MFKEHPAFLLLSYCSSFRQSHEPDIIAVNEFDLSVFGD